MLDILQLYGSVDNLKRQIEGFTLCITGFEILREAGKDLNLPKENLKALEAALLEYRKQRNDCFDMIRQAESLMVLRGLK